MALCAMDAEESSYLESKSFDQVLQTEEGIKGGEVVEDVFHYQLESVPLKHKQPVKVPFIKECLDVKGEDDEERRGRGEQRRGEARRQLPEPNRATSDFRPSVRSCEAEGGDGEQVHGAGHDEVHRAG